MEKGRIPPVERKRKEKGKAHRKREALEVIERGYRSEHKSLMPKKTHCV